MYQIKLIVSTKGEKDLEIQVNEWLRQHADVEVVGVSTDSRSEDKWMFLTATILYKKGFGDRRTPYPRENL